MITQDQIKQVTNENSRHYEVQVDGELFKLISVTTVLSRLLSKPALVPWAYNIGIKETLNLLQSEPEAIHDYLTIQSNEVKQRLAQAGRGYNDQRVEAAERGTLVHSCLEAYIAGEPLPADLRQVRGYVDSLDAFIRDYNPEWHESELTVLSLKHEYAGTLDAVCTIRKHPKRRKHESLVGKTVVLDLKTNREGKVYTPDNLLQIDAYSEAYLEMGYPKPDAEMIVALSEKGTYSPCVNYYPEGIFSGCILPAFKALELAKSLNPNGRKTKSK